MARNLTEKQQKFLDVLFEEAGGNLVTAKKLAGYADAVTSRQVAEPLADEIAELTKKFITSSATKAAYSMFEVMNNPTDLGNKEKMAAAKDVLDRSGFTKTEKVEVSATSPLFILPQKSDEDE
jgi:phage terminase small subunit